MKFLKIFQAALLATAVTFSFTACDDDDDPEPGTENNDGGTNGTTTPPVSNAGILFPVTSINGGPSYSVTFNYVDGRMVSGDNDGSSFVIHSNPLRIQQEYIGEDGGYERVNMNNIKVNASGFITYGEFTYDGLEYYYDLGEKVEERWHATGSGTFAYDSDGHMTSAIFHSEDEEEVDHSEINYTWSNGDLIKFSEHYTWNNKEEEDNGEMFFYTTFSYGLSRPNPGIFLPCVMDFWDADYLWYAGLLGAPSQNIPTSYASGEGEEGNEYTYTNTIDVKYNPNGSVSELTVSENSYKIYKYIFGYGATKAAAVSAPGTKKPVFGPAKRMIERMKSRRNNK